MLEHFFNSVNAGIKLWMYEKFAYVESTSIRLKKCVIVKVKISGGRIDEDNWNCKLCDPCWALTERSNETHAGETKITFIRQNVNQENLSGVLKMLRFLISRMFAQQEFCFRLSGWRTFQTSYSKYFVNKRWWFSNVKYLLQLAIEP